MRVLHVYSGNLYGGVETFLATLARCRDLCPTMEPHFALCFEGRLSRELIHEKVSVYCLGKTRASRPWTVMKARRNLAKLLREGVYDLAICHSSWSQAIFGPVARFIKIPLVFYLHGPITSMNWVDRWAALTVPNLVIGVSQHTVQTGRQLYPNVPTEVLNYPMPWPSSKFVIPDRGSIRSQLDVRGDTTVIIQVSRMEEWKGHDLHLHALACLLDLPNWVCWFVGGAQRPKEVKYVKYLKSLVSQLALNDRIVFLGERQDVPQLLGAADIFCQVNRGPEGFSLAFLEAFSAGLPIVTIGIGGAPELINQSCGITVRDSAPQTVARALRRLILDPKLRETMGVSARTRVHELCDTGKQIGRLSSLLTKVYQEVATRNEH